MDRVFRKAYLVVGAASSGTRVTTEILVRNGCFGNSQHVQPTDGLNDPSIIAPHNFVVIRRSIPHDVYTPDLKKIYDYLRAGGFESIHTVVVIRNWDYIAKSQVRRGFADSMGASKKQIQTAYKTILDSITPEYIFFSYEFLVSRPRVAQEWLCKQLGLEFKNAVEVINGNEKYEKP